MFRLILHTTVLAAGIGLVPAPVHPQDSTGASGSTLSGARFRNADMVISAARGTPLLDGVLSPGEWEGAAELNDFVQFQPDPDRPATQPTRAWIMYDDHHLYLAFRCEQPDAAVQDYITRRNHIQNNPDYVGILLDPFLSWKEAYLFIVNPAGIQADDIMGIEGNVNGDWNGLWTSAARVHEWGWTAELAIPWTTLRFPPADGRPWGINLIRSVGGISEQSTWAPLDIRANSILASNGLLRGIEGVRPGRNLWLNPYTTLRTAREGTAAGGTDWRRHAGLNHAGLDFRAGVGSNMMLNLTLNPDFGHIEADQEQINLTPYELLFAERRPFFAEGGRVFEMPITLFYSRRIHNPAAGAKLTGHLGERQIGIISAYNEPLSSADFHPYAQQSVARLKQGFGRSSYLGVILTSVDIASQTDHAGGYVRNAGFDFDLRPSDRFNVSGMMAASVRSGEQGGQGAWYLAAAYTHRTWGAGLTATEVPAGFQAPLGYIPRLGQRRLSPFLNYRHEADLGQIKWITPALNLTRYEDSGGRLIEQRLTPGLSVQFRSNAWAGLNLAIWENRINGHTYQGRSLSGNASANRSGPWNGYGGFNLGDGLDYGNGGQGDERVVFHGSLNGGVSWRPTPRASGSLYTHLVQRAQQAGGTVVDQIAVGGVQVQYQFTREFFGRLNLQMRRHHLRQDRPEPVRGQRVTANLLAGWEWGPGTVFYVAYNHYDNGNGPIEGIADRVLFVKIARLLAL